MLVRRRKRRIEIEQQTVRMEMSAGSPTPEASVASVPPPVDGAALTPGPSTAQNSKAPLLPLTNANKDLQ